LILSGLELALAPGQADVLPGVIGENLKLGSRLSGGSWRRRLPTNPVGENKPPSRDADIHPALNCQVRRDHMVVRGPALAVARLGDDLQTCLMRKS